MARSGSARSRRRQAAPEPTGTLVDSTLRFLRLDDTVRSMRAMRAFDAVVGARIRARARAERLRGRTLYIRVASSAWSQELHVLRASILERLRGVPGGEEVHDLRFQVGDVESLPTWNATPSASDAKHASPNAAPPNALLDAIAEIPDPELRERFRALVGRAHGR
jgi:hypothetical protein